MINNEVQAQVDGSMILSLTTGEKLHFYSVSKMINYLRDNEIDAVFTEPLNN